MIDTSPLHVELSNKRPLTKEESIILGHFLYHSTHKPLKVTHRPPGPHPYPIFKSGTEEYEALIKMERFPCSIHLGHNFWHAIDKWGEEIWYVEKTILKSKVHQGQYGSIPKILGVIRFNPDHSAVFTPIKNAYANKLQRRKLEAHNYETIDEFVERVNNEANLASRDPKNRVTKPTFFREELDEPYCGRNVNDSSVFGMDYFKGKSLKSLLKFASEHKDILNTRHRLRICINLIFAIMQMQQNRIFHRDLKPDNVMVDLGLRIRIIDYGLSADFDAKPDHVFGNFAYAPIEALYGKKWRSKSDCIALAWILHLILGGDDNLSTQGLDSDSFHVQLDALKKNLMPLQFEKHNALKDVDDLPQAAKDLLLKTLNSLGFADIGKRWSPKDALLFFTHALLAYDIANFENKDSAYVEAYKKGFLEGVLLRDKLFNLAEKPLFVHAEGFNDLRNVIFESINALPDKPEALMGFLEQANVVCLYEHVTKQKIIDGEISKETLRAKVNGIIQQYEKKLIELNNQCIPLAILNQEASLPKEQKEIITKWLHKLVLLVRRENGLRLTIDHVALMGRKFEKYQGLLEKDLADKKIVLPSLEPNPSFSKWGLFAVQRQMKVDIIPNVVRMQFKS